MNMNVMNAILCAMNAFAFEHDSNELMCDWCVCVFEASLLRVHSISDVNAFSLHRTFFRKENETISPI